MYRLFNLRLKPGCYLFNDPLEDTEMQWRMHMTSYASGYLFNDPLEDTEITCTIAKPHPRHVTCSTIR